ncbi:MAG TPA: arginine--tRNA ligase, partial [Conexibacter sp.]|nr:arginine--tRNA ligase [Conexibacter sp.]
MTDNLLDSVEATLHAVDPAAFRVVPILREKEAADVSAIALRPDAAPLALEALTADPAIASVEQQGQRFLMRFTDERIAETGAGLEAGRFTGMETDDLRSGTRAIVDFCDPNATKALHVGHLRTVALGHALGCLAASCGADVVHQTQIGDVGRQMGEAMAGYLTFYEGVTPESAGIKSDHFVGRCYSRYVAQLAPAEVGGGTAADPALSREDGSYDDLAEQLLVRLGAGDPEVEELWRRMRGWALEGHDETLARLGVIFDRVIYEVDFLDDTHALTARALDEGIVRRSDDGAVISHERDDGHLLLHRPDGFPTTHMRCMGMWHLTGRELLAGATSLALVGDEWEPLVQQG